MFDGIAEHEVAEHEVAEHECLFVCLFFFFTKLLIFQVVSAYFSICFFLIYFYLTI